MNIISASRRTDIPALYSEWFMNRLRQGYALVRNPFNPSQISRVDLRPEKVACIVFWTRDPRPLFPHLAEMEDRGYRSLFHVTLTGLPPRFEPAAPPAPRILDAMTELSGRIGRERLIWRFDPILLSSLTRDTHYHRVFDLFSERLRGATSTVMTSFADFYGQVRRRLEKEGIDFEDILEPGAEPFIERAGAVLLPMVETARKRGMEIFACAPERDLSRLGVMAGRCIDAKLIGRVFGLKLIIPRDSGQRKKCGCSRSRDIGSYGTCSHGCIYCYASRGAALKKGARHDPASPFLIEIKDERKKEQLDLF